MITNYSDLTISDFQKLQKIKESEFEFEIERELAILEVMTSIPLEELEGMPRHQIIDLNEKCTFWKFEIPYKLRKSFRLGFKRYYIELDARNISAEQFILVNKYTKSEAATIENLHYILAAMTYERKWWRKKPYSENFEAKAELFKNELTIDIAYPVSLFFCNLYPALLEVTKTYLMSQIENQIQKAKFQMEREVIS